MTDSLVGSGEGGALYIYGSLKTRARLNSAVVRSSTGHCIVYLRGWDIMITRIMIREGNQC
jgi:hypothetical protein